MPRIRGYVRQNVVFLKPLLELDHVLANLATKRAEGTFLTCQSKAGDKSDLVRFCEEDYKPLDRCLASKYVRRLSLP